MKFVGPREEQIIATSREYEAGVQMADVTRGTSEAIICNWKVESGMMDVTEANRLTILEDKNAKLSKLLVNQLLEEAALRERLSKKAGAPSSAQLSGEPRAQWNLNAVIHDSMARRVQENKNAIKVQVARRSPIVIDQERNRD